jgi:hypothetical protein
MGTRRPVVEIADLALPPLLRGYTTPPTRRFGHHGHQSPLMG